MLSATLKIIFARDLNKLKSEIKLYKNEKSIWKVDKGISNSAGNLCLHLIGNLNTYIGAEIGKTNYIRHRDIEFSTKNVPRNQLIEQIEDTIILINDSLNRISIDEVNNEFPILIFEEKTSVEYLLIHLTTHLTYHLGQINYHRRLFDHL